MNAFRDGDMRQAGVPRMNIRDLVLQTVSGQIVDPVVRPNPYRIGADGRPRILPGPGGIVLNHRVGDRCVGLAGDHIEPGVAIRNDRPAGSDNREGANLALQTYTCIGNLALVVDGNGAGERGFVTGKHGGVNHVLIDFALRVLRRLRNGDRIQIYACGLGLRLLDHPHVTVMNASVRLLRRWGLRADGERLAVPVTHYVPSAIMGSGIGRNNAVQGDCDIQLFDREAVRRFRLDRLRFGDFVAIADADHSFGRAVRSRSVSIGVIIHGDSTVSGHGPGVVTLLTGEARWLLPRRDPRANLAEIMGLRRLPPARQHPPLVHAEQGAAASHCACSRLRRNEQRVQARQHGRGEA